MPSIRKEFTVNAAPERVWDAFRDVGAVATRLGPGFVTSCRLDGPDARVLTFANGLATRELIVDVDDHARRLVWAAVGGRLTHHNASMQVFADGQGRSRVVWVADLLPNELAGYVSGLIEQGLGVMKQTLEKP
jgi:carbon monoxide dehydrogenase subunit G